MRTAPCKGCSKRHLGCHANCEEYLDFRKWKTELNEKIRKEKEAFVECQRQKRILWLKQVKEHHFR